MIYVAAPWMYRGEAKLVVERFRAAGIKVSSSWVDWKGSASDERDPKILAREAGRDWDEVVEADFLILLNWERSEGKAIETGIALSEGIPIIGVGKPTAVFHYLSKHIRWVSTVDQAIAEVKRVISKTK